MKSFSFLTLLLLAAVACADETPESWTTPVDPVRIAGNIYYVGTQELGAYLLVDDAGLVLLDVPHEKNTALILRNIAKLGFDPKRVKAVLASHAHLDHIGGFAEFKEETGAPIYLSAADAELAARGGKNDFAFGDRFLYPPVKADRIVKDGDVVRVGKTAMTAVITPGHTRGCTTWRTTVVENGKPLDVVFLCSVSAPGYKLVNNEKYPELFDDYRRSFAKLRAIHPDIFLANHASFFDLDQKLAKKKPFVAPGEFEQFIEEAWTELEAKEKKQREPK